MTAQLKKAVIKMIDMTNSNREDKSIIDKIFDFLFEPQLYFASSIEDFYSSYYTINPNEHKVCALKPTTKFWLDKRAIVVFPRLNVGEELITLQNGKSFKFYDPPGSFIGGLEKISNRSYQSDSEYLSKKPIIYLPFFLFTTLLQFEPNLYSFNKFPIGYVNQE